MDFETKERLFIMPIVLTYAIASVSVFITFLVFTLSGLRGKGVLSQSDVRTIAFLPWLCVSLLVILLVVPALTRIIAKANLNHVRGNHYWYVRRLTWFITIHGLIITVWVSAIGYLSGWLYPSGLGVVASIIGGVYTLWFVVYAFYRIIRYLTVIQTKPAP